MASRSGFRSEEHTSELQSLRHLVCRLLLEKTELRPARLPRFLSSPATCRRPAGRSAARGGRPHEAPPTYPSQGHFFFFFNDTATTEIYTLSLHDALPICFLSFVFNRLDRPSVEP